MVGDSGEGVAVEVSQLVVQSWPFVSAAVGAYGTAVLTQATDLSAASTVSLGQRVLQRLWNREEGRDPLQRAVDGVVAEPEDEDAQAALRQEIKRALREDAALLEDVRAMLGEAPVVQENYRAVGERSVAVRENHGSISTGDVPNRR